MSAVSTTVEVDREQLENLYLEASVVAEIITRIGGTCPADLVEPLETATEKLLEVLVGGRDMAKQPWWDRVRERANETVQDVLLRPRGGAS